MNHEPECTCACCLEDSGRDSATPDFSRYAETLREYEKKVRSQESQQRRRVRENRIYLELARQAESGGARHGS